MFLCICLEFARGAYRLHKGCSVGIGVKEAVESGLVSTDIFNGNPGKNVLCNGVNDGDLLLNRNGRILILLEYFNDSRTLIETCLCIGIQIGTELSEALQLSVLGVDQLQRTGYLFIGLICAAPPTRLTLIPTSMAGR